jgi:hypothetical protein
MRYLILVLLISSNALATEITPESLTMKAQRMTVTHDECVKNAIYLAQKHHLGVDWKYQCSDGVSGPTIVKTNAKIPVSLKDYETP